MPEELFTTKNPNPHEHRSDGTTAIMLVQKNGERWECVVDTSDYGLVSRHRWALAKAKHCNYAVTSTRNKKRKVNIARLILPESELILYRNHDGLDNRRSNLIAGTQSDKSRHKRKHKNLSSQFKGVHKLKGSFRASIKVGNRYHSLGEFTSEAEAARRYNDEAAKLFGSVAHLNEIPNGEEQCKPSL